MPYKAMNLNVVINCFTKERRGSQITLIMEADLYSLWYYLYLMHRLIYMDVNGNDAKQAKLVLLRCKINNK